MKGETMIDFDKSTVRVSVVLETMEDAGRAMEMIRNAARACWPDIMFADETLDETNQTYESFETPHGEEAPASGDDEPVPEAPEVEGFVRTAPPPPRAFDHSAAPRPGSLTDKVLQTCRSLNTDDYKQVSDALGIDGGAAARLVANLKRGGHLQARPCN